MGTQPNIRVGKRFIGYVKWEIAWSRWAKTSNTPDPGKSLMQYLGVSSFYEDPYSSGYHLTNHSADKLELLLSPHYKTIIKAWEAKQDALSKQESKK